MADSSIIITETDEPLVISILQGNVASFRNIVKRFWNMVVTLVRTKIAVPTEAEDIAWESFLKTDSQLYMLWKPSWFVWSLSKIAFGSKVTPIEDLERQPAQTNLLGLTEKQIHFVRCAIRRMPEKFPQLIMMIFIAGLPAMQIAKQLGKHLGTVRVWLHQTFEILHKNLAQLLKEIES
jgi:DNA-directed RNA polymerase specialized sigma24 family protein